MWHVEQAPLLPHEVASLCSPAGSLLKRSAFLCIHPGMGSLSPVQPVCAEGYLQHRSNKKQTTNMIWDLLAY